MTDLRSSSPTSVARRDPSFSRLSLPRSAGVVSLYPKLSRRTVFALVDDGDSRKICALPSSKNLLAQDEEAKTCEEAKARWKCSSCSSVNEDGNNCFFCGAGRSCCRADTGVCKSTHPDSSTRNIDDSKARSRMVDEGMLRRSSSGTRPRTAPAAEAPPTTFGRRGVSEGEMNMSFRNWSASDNAAWTCGSCTYVNDDPLYLTCAVCGQGRSQELPASPLLPRRIPRVRDTDHSVASSQDQLIECQRKKLLELEQKAIERERLNELIDMQFEALDEIREEKELQDAINISRNNTPDGLRDRRRRMEQIRHQLTETQQRIEHLERILREEKAEQDLMEKTLHDLRLEIAQDARKHNEENHDGKVSQSSHRLLQVIAQERMLEDWRHQWEAREQQLKEISRQQQELLDIRHRK